jgi:hypothetical protein
MATILSQSIADVDMELMKYRTFDTSNENNPSDQWIQGALNGKINQAYKAMKAEWVPKLMDDSSISAISASKEDFVGQVINHPSYKTKFQLEASSSVA